MVKIYKSKNGKLVIYLPFDVVSSLKLKDGEEVDFYAMNGGNYLFAKKADVTSLILGQAGKPPIQLQQKPQSMGAAVQQSQRATVSSFQPTAEELSVLKKIDTLRYENRTQENTLKILGDSEKKVLQRLLAKRVISLFKGKDGKDHYSIPKDVYDNFLMRKKPEIKEEVQAAAKIIPRIVPPPSYKEPQDENVEKLQKDGFIVLQTEAEASKVSILLEQSIKHGQVLGTRSFSKKFYIVLRTYFDRWSLPILKKLRDRSYRIPDLADELKMNEDGARAILYLLSENGDVSEKKRDMFTIA